LVPALRRRGVETSSFSPRPVSAPRFPQDWINQDRISGLAHRELTAIGGEIDLVAMTGARATHTRCGPPPRSITIVGSDCAGLVHSRLRGITRQVCSGWATGKLDRQILALSATNSSDCSSANHALAPTMARIERAHGKSISRCIAGGAAAYARTRDQLASSPKETGTGCFHATADAFVPPAMCSTWPIASGSVLTLEGLVTVDVMMQTRGEG